MGPFMLVDLLGLDIALHIAEGINEAYGERFHVHRGMQELVAAGKLGAAVRRRGSMSTGAELTARRPRSDERLERCTLKALRRGLPCPGGERRTVRDIDLGLMAGAGLDPAGPFPPRRRRRRTRHVLEGAGAGGAGVGRGALRLAARSSGGSSPGPARSQDRGRGSSPSRSPTTASRARRCKLDTREDGRDRVARPTRPRTRSRPQVIEDLGDHLEEGRPRTARSGRW